mgnify:CR=1 FL=1
MADNEEYTTEDKLDRLAEMIDWMLYHNVVASRRELALRMNYTESTLSCVVNGRQPISPKFLTALSQIDPRLNVDWIDTGKGEMIIEEETTSVPSTAEELEAVRLQQENIRMLQEQLTSIIKMGNAELVKMQQSLIEKASEQLEILTAALVVGREKVSAIIGKNIRNNYINSPNSGNRGSLNGMQRAKRYIKKK